MRWTTKATLSRRIVTSVLLWLVMLMLSIQMKTADADTIHYPAAASIHTLALLENDYLPGMFTARLSDNQYAYSSGIFREPNETLTRQVQHSQADFSVASQLPMMKLPLPASAWLFFTGLIGLTIVTRRQAAS